jgi:hypothetical protein
VATVAPGTCTDRRQQEPPARVNGQSARLARLHLAIAPVGQLPGLGVEVVDGDTLLGGDGDVDEGVGPGSGHAEQRGGDGDHEVAGHLPPPVVAMS